MKTLFPHKPHLLLAGFLLVIHLAAQGQINEKSLASRKDTSQTSSRLDSRVLKLTEQHFNGGFVTNPLQLLQGQSPSLFTSRAGSDPNGVFDMRIRGIKSFDITEPLILVDGMPVYSIDAIHPNDIASVEVLTDALSMANWGIRGSNGILSIHTKKGTAGKMKINYRLIRSAEKITKKPNILDGRDYARYGGRNLGAQTDWWEEITRKANSYSHHLSLSGGTKTASYYASLNYDEVNGIVNRSGFDRLNGRISFQQKALRDKLSLQVGLASTTRNSTLTPLVAMWYATSHNPTAPVYSDAPEDERWGGFFEITNIYDTFNPVSILEQNDFTQKQKNLNMQLNAELEITAALSAKVNYFKQNQGESKQSYYASTSFFVGADRNGYAEQVQFDVDNEYLSGGLYLDKKMKGLQVKGSLSYHYQDINEQYYRAAGGDFLTDVFGVNNMSASQDFANGRGQVKSFQQRNEMSRYLANLGLTLKDKYQVQASLSREGSSRLGIDNKWGTFYGIQAKAWLTQHFTARVNVSKTGNLPSRGLLSQGIYREQQTFFYNGEFITSFGKQQRENPNLGSETTQEWSLGLDFSLLENRLQGSVDYYQSYSRQLIQQISDFSPEYLGQQRHINAGGINSSGLEIQARYQWFNSQNFSWNVGLAATVYGKTSLEAYAFNPGETFHYVGILGGRCSFPIFRLEEGGNLGSMWGFRLHPDRPVDGNGQWNIVDQDGNGFRDRSDYVPVGNAMPKLSYGITQNIRAGNFHIDFLMRGLLGHDVINHVKSFHSVRSIISHYNVHRDAVTELSDLQDFADFNSRDVEDASFLRLSYINLGYELPLKNKKLFQQIRLYVGAQNLFTISSYKGLDPEFRLEDADTRTPFNTQGYYGQVIGDIGNPLVMGMDRRNSYPMSRSFLMGINLSL